jgi:protein-S-isoprenylcysteine O-methyltransferase Ste14
MMGATFLVLWIGWIAYWMIAARSAKTTRWREPLGQQWLHGGLAILAAILLAVPLHHPAWLAFRFVPRDLATASLGLALTALGLGFAVAARVYLAGNWSAAVEVKEDHALIRGGPYRWVRHPIYSGLLLAFLGTALALGRWRGLLAVAFLFLAFLLKARHEEAGMRRTFPDYESYARVTAALIPGIF